jgi:hypothetical protein
MSTMARTRLLSAMPAHARVWVYKSAAALTAEQQDMILERGARFTADWAAHGAALDACVDVLHDHFVVVSVDEQQAMASGCSIDKSVRFVQELERELGASLTDRMVVLYEKEGAVRTCRVPEVESLIKQGELSTDTVVFDDLVGTKSDMDRRFRVPLKESWMGRWL